MQEIKLTPLALAIFGLPAFAGTAPDAGQTIRENAPVIQAPAESKKFKIKSPTGPDAVKGGATVVLLSVTFTGNSHISQDELTKVIGDVAGKSFDLAGLRSITNQVGDYYHTKGYSFARAYLPAQALTDGNLEIVIVEGNYGKISTLGDEKLAPAAMRFLTDLNSGDPIFAPKLERDLLVLDDQPGVKVTPLIRPGQALGTGDLDVRVEREKRFASSIGLDNHGNRYTGRNRLKANAEANSSLTLGDQVTASGLYTEEDMWFGSLGYSLPIGGRGLRAQLNVMHTYYELGKEFKSLEAHGVADVASAGLSYPIFRSQLSNLSISANYQHKWMSDKQDSTNTSDTKSSDTLPIALNFDIRDGFGGGAVTYGAFTWMHGKLNLGSGADKTNDVSANTDGRFDKFNLELARNQLLPRNFSAYTRLSAQWTSTNLDSSESFGLGGINGVRAYPTGEGFGDEGALLQAEIRYAKALDNGVNLSPYAFYDIGSVKINHNNWTSDKNHRNISGAGFGVRTNYNGWSADLALAWRLNGGQPESDTKNYYPMFWLSAGYRY